MIATIEIHNGVRVVAVDTACFDESPCDWCAFSARPLEQCRLTPCVRDERQDNRDVFFVKLEETPNEQSNN